MERPRNVWPDERPVTRVRAMLDGEGERGRLFLAARAPSDYGRTAPSYETARAIGCAPVSGPGRWWHS